MAKVSGGGGIAATLGRIGKALDKAHEVRVGFLDGATYPEGGLNVPTVAALNNFGAPGAGIPARPFFSGMIAQEKGMWGERFGTIMKAVDMDAHKALELMGEGIAGQLKAAIINFSGAPNSPVTDFIKERFPMAGQTFADVQQAREDVAKGERAAKKGKPLIHTGHMLNSVDKEVV